MTGESLPATRTSDEHTRPAGLSPDPARAGRTRPGPAAARTGPPKPARGHQDLDPEPAAA